MYLFIIYFVFLLLVAKVYNFRLISFTENRDFFIFEC